MLTCGAVFGAIGRLTLFYLSAEYCDRIPSTIGFFNMEYADIHQKYADQYTTC